MFDTSAKALMVVVATGCALLLSASTSAETYLLLANGSGSFPTIQAALDVVVNGDVIELANGTFDGDGNRDVDFLGKAVTIRSQSGDPNDVTIDCGGDEFDPHRAFVFDSGEGASSVLQEITITNGYMLTHGGGIYCQSSSPTISGCIFGSNVANGSESYGGAIYCTGTSSPTITGCYFIGNGASEFGNGRGGAVACRSGANATISNCHVEGNYAEYRGGGVYCDQCDVTFTDCIVENNGADSGAGIYLRHGTYTLTDCTVLWNETWVGRGGGLLADYECTLEITGCTFMGNHAINGGGMYVDVSEFTMNRTIVAFSLGGGGVHYAYEPRRDLLSVSCCNVFDNTGGNYTGQIGDQTGSSNNISEDPLFCDAPSGDLTVYNTSPCASANSPCSQRIGSSDVDCETPVEMSSWGRVKATFE